MSLIEKNLIEDKRYQELKQEFNRKYYTDADTNKSRWTFYAKIKIIEDKNNTPIYTLSLQQLYSNIKALNYKYATAQLFVFYLKALYKFLCDNVKDFKFENKHPIELLKHTDFAVEEFAPIDDLITSTDEVIDIINKTYTTNDISMQILYGYIILYLGTFPVDLTLLEKITYKNISFAEQSITCYCKDYKSNTILPIEIPITDKKVFTLFFNWYKAVKEYNSSRKQKTDSEQLFTSSEKVTIERKLGIYTHRLSKYIKENNNDLLSEAYVEKTVMYKNIRISSILHRINKTDNENDGVVCDILNKYAVLKKKYLQGIEKRVQTMYASLHEIQQCCSEYRTYRKGYMEKIEKEKQK